MAQNPSAVTQEQPTAARTAQATTVSRTEVTSANNEEAPAAVSDMQSALAPTAVAPDAPLEQGAPAVAAVSAGLVVESPVQAPTPPTNTGRSTGQADPPAAGTPPAPE
eukprot:1164272-Amphidinium_carterae.1